MLAFCDEKHLVWLATRYSAVSFGWMVSGRLMHGSVTLTDWPEKKTDELAMQAPKLLHMFQSEIPASEKKNNNGETQQLNIDHILSYQMFSIALSYIVFWCSSRPFRPTCPTPHSRHPFVPPNQICHFDMLCGGSVLCCASDARTCENNLIIEATQLDKQSAKGS